MKIVFLDSETLDAGDIDWERLRELGTVITYDRTDKDLIVERAKESNVLITNKCMITSEILSLLPELQLICVAATGYDNIDVEAANKLNIKVANVSNYSTYSVVQHVFAMLLYHMNTVGYYSEGVKKQNRWARSKEFAYTDGPIINLEGLTMGIYGYGTIGKAVARTALSFGMRVFANKRDLTQQPDTPGVTLVDQEELVRSADVLTLHASANTSTHHFINKETLALMQPNAIIVNTARGSLIDESALFDWLHTHPQGTALLDVMDEEPAKYNHPLYQLGNCIITPHQAWIGQRSRHKLYEGIVKNIERFKAGMLRGIELS